MAAAAGFLNHSMTSGQALMPLDSSTSGTSSTSSGSSSSSSSSSDTAVISANDFLELLVTEMQNQDPTDATDPNEYIDQLVDVNSLEQLIDINQTLSGAFPAASSTDTGDAAAAQTSGASATPLSTSALTAGPQATGSAAAPALSDNSVSGALAARHPAGAQAAATPQAVRRASGNLSVPAANPAAERVAHALDGRPRARPLGGKLTQVEQTTLNNRP
ncbi:MAG TPA: flagellar hook capping FlgD N-terminal domain-containing protein [Terracidiphilus sp.]|nr:flagellar hook capping FlgD N-terminal domain-containing protein [Terracidiphilus sp.]